MRLISLATFVAFSLQAAAPGWTGSAACAICHQEIYASYMRTPMAASSGPVGTGLIQEKFDRATFSHAPSGFQYRVSLQGDRYSLNFGKRGGLGGDKQLKYFVGSGTAARSYLLAEDGFLFEAPVAYYAVSRRWDLPPGYDQYSYPYLTRPVQPGCLNCHASFLKPIQGTQNRFTTPPFGEGGVGCERCHGPGESHIASMKTGQRPTHILNPSKLDLDRRDSLCSQCHLSGEARVMRAGRAWSSYQPGDRLSDSMIVFIRAGSSAGLKVTGHVEKLAQSACKRAAGAKLWCGSCHDPHSLPPAQERVSWFRTRCLACHQPGDCREAASARRANGDDCIPCHMPKSAVVDAQHVVYTDHSIPRSGSPQPAAPIGGEVVPFGGGTPNPRDLALAYAIAGVRHDTDRQRATPLLEKAERESPDDIEVLLYLAEIYRKNSQSELAIPRYRRALQLDPEQVTALVGLGAIHMERREYTEAIRLWNDALTRNSGLQLVRMNLALAYWRVGDLASARSVLEQAIRLNPAFAPAVDLLKRLRRDPPN